MIAFSLLGGAGDGRRGGDELVLVVDQQDADERQHQDGAPDEQGRAVDRDRAHRRRARRDAADRLEDDQRERADQDSSVSGMWIARRRYARRERLDEDPTMAAPKDDQQRGQLEVLEGGSRDHWPSLTATTGAGSVTFTLTSDSLTAGLITSRSGLGKKPKTTIRAISGATTQCSRAVEVLHLGDRLGRGAVHGALVHPQDVDGGAG